MQNCTSSENNCEDHMEENAQHVVESGSTQLHSQPTVLSFKRKTERKEEERKKEKEKEGKKKEKVRRRKGGRAKYTFTHVRISPP